MTCVLLAVLGALETKGLCGVEDALIAVQDDKGQWGWINLEGDVVIKPQKRFTQTFNSVNGYAKFSEHGRTGIVNTKGDLRISSEQFYDIKHFSEQYAPALREAHGDVFLIDTTGNVAPILTEHSGYDVIGRFYEGLAAVRNRETQRWGFIDSNARLVIPAEYVSVSGFSDGLSKVTLQMDRQDISAGIPKLVEPEVLVASAEYFYIDRTGARVSPQTYTYHEGGFFNDRAIFFENDLFGFMDKKFAPVIPAQFKLRPSNFVGGYASVTVDLADAKKRVGIIDREGNFSFGPLWIKKDDYLNGISKEDRACLCIDGKAGIINQKGDYIVAADYDSCESYGNGVMLARKAKEEFLLRASDGKILWRRKL
jgi:hypothetical protein